MSPLLATPVLLIGSNIRQDQPILGHRLRSAWRLSGARIMDINPVAYDFHFELAQRLTVAPQAMARALGAIARTAAELTDSALPQGELGRFIAGAQLDTDTRPLVDSLRRAERGLIILGDGALNHPLGACLRHLAEWLAGVLNVALCVLPGPANSQGAWLAGSVPDADGLNARAMLEQPRHAYLLLGLDPDLDLARPALARQAFVAADRVVALSAYANPALLDAADVLLPLAELPETEGSYWNLDGRLQHFKAAVRPPADARPGWKILRQLGELLGLDGFAFTELGEVSAALEDFQAPPAVAAPATAPAGEAELARVGDVPMYASDALVRRSPPLQAITQADVLRVRLHPATVASQGLIEGQRLRLRQGAAWVEFDWMADARIAPDAVWLPTALTDTVALDGAYDALAIEVV